jgi:ribosomal protein S18 acetylase RimI-like enzyme
MEITFTTEVSISRADEIVAYMMGPRLWIPRIEYPDFEHWIDKVHGQLKSESKRAVVAIVAGQVVGAVIYQQHRELPSTIEIKNLTVRPDHRGRHLASFLVRNAEAEGARDFEATQVVVDTKLDNLPVRQLLTSHHYQPQAVSDLYRLNAGPDVVYSKGLLSVYA